MNTQRIQHFRERYGPWAVVTGASNGIGRECARQLGSWGLNLVVVARNEAALRQLVHEFPEQEIRTVTADLSAAGAVEAIESSIRDLDVGLLVAAAGFGTSGEFRDANLADELDMLEVNCASVVRQAHHFANRFVRRGRGGIVLFGSLVGYQGVPRAAHYAATKAFVQSLAEGLHVELGRHGVDVISSAPGPVRSGFGSRARMTMGAAETPGTVARETLRALGKRMTVTPGWMSKFLTGSLMTAPRSLRVRIMAKVMGGMTRAPS